MSFHRESTLAGYARTAGDVRTRMVEYARSGFARQYLEAFLACTPDPPTGSPHVTKAALAVFDRVAHEPWRDGHAYVVAPELTATLVAAARSVNLTGHVVSPAVAPSDAGVVLLPEPIYQRDACGEVTSIGAIAWTTYRTIGTGRTGWWITGWADRDDPLDPAAGRRRAQLTAAPALAAQLGPYVLVSLADIPAGTPLTPLDEPHRRVDQVQESAPDGRCCIDDPALRQRAVAALLHAFWRLQRQSTATVIHPPLEPAERLHTQRPGLGHGTRIVTPTPSA